VCVVAAAAAITTVSVVYLDETLGMSGTQIGIFFLVTLLATLPGTQLGAFVTRRTNPNTSLRLSMMSLLVVLNIGAIILEGFDNDIVTYSWGACVGVLLGWFYPTEGLFFSMVLPKGQEAELAGFFVYCTQILAWLPPLLFTILVENDVAQKWGVVVTSFGFLVATGLLTLAAPWEDIVKEARQDLKKEAAAKEDVEALSGDEGEENEESVGVKRSADYVPPVTPEEEN
jgi:MFS-type transporter involved in bile tolerance (Atg22 family)